MKESDLYLDFLKRYLLVFILSLVLSLLFAFFLYSKDPPEYKAVGFVELSEYLNNVEKKERITDEVVAHMRSENVQQMIGLDGSARFSVFKPGPFSIQLEVVSESPDESRSNLSKAMTYILSSFEVEERGVQTIKSMDKNPYKYLIFGFLTGISIAISFSLLKEYFRLY